MDEYINPEEEYRCSKCGIMLESQWAEGGNEDLCGDCLEKLSTP